MNPQLSRRVALLTYKPAILALSFDDAAAFFSRVMKAPNFGALSAADQNLILTAEKQE